jgi:exo-beta-1,3-glucanase (GH17 family)/cellulose synthase/poly-beta-1,6-N-acetylglucosamine synthase-like glycosyltransferase
MTRFGLRLSALLIALMFGAITIGTWAYMNQAQSEPSWPRKVQGFAFSPYQADQDAVKDEFPTREQIAGDLELLRGKTNAVRTYTTEGTIGLVPELAAERGINVALGAWIDSRRDHNDEELARTVALAKQHKNVVRVVVGNEAVLRNDVPLEEFNRYLEEVRAQVKQPVSTCEPWHVWIDADNRSLAEHVDYICIHLLPYWEGIEVERAVEYSIEKLRIVKEAFPGKPVIVGEVGWPSNGRTRESAVASQSNEALFLRRFLSWAEREGIVYYIMEAFDQPWKGQTEGAVGAYWGVYDANRNPKFEFIKPIVRTPAWEQLAAVSVVLAAAMLFWFYMHSGALKNRGRSFLALIVYATSAITTWVIYDYSQQYLTVTNVAVGVLLFLGMLGVIAVLLAEAHEWAEAHWVHLRRRLLVGPAAHAENPAYWPPVSIHVPAYNEPPEMLIETLDALAKLDYPDFEVLVIDNNTKDEAVWRPVEAHCATLGPRFRFFHVDPLAGFKAGALNFALRHTRPEAEIVAVIDSDYVVERDWLRHLTPVFAHERIAIVQAPQDYRDDEQNAFKAMCHAEYRGFFHIGMVTRNERNAIIQHGTMTMVRRRLLDELGGWAEWNITEDAELGLRVFERGYEATYIPHSYGRGLMPDTFIDFKKQRFRWAYGAMQILRAHAGELFGRKESKLTSGQRYHFLAGWLPWVADGFNLIFNFFAILWTILMLYAPRTFDAPLAVFSVLPLTLFVFKLAKLMHLYRVRVGAGTRQAIAASIAGLGLAHTIGLATLKGLFTKGEPFFRTPKDARSQTLWGALMACREELLMATALLLGAWAASTTLVEGSLDRMRTDSPDLRAWILVMCVQAIPYLSAVIASLISALPIPARWIGQGYLPVEGGEEYAQLVPDPMDPPFRPAAAGAPAGASPTSDVGATSANGPSSSAREQPSAGLPTTPETRKAS